MTSKLRITGIPTRKKYSAIWKFLLGNKVVLRDSTVIYLAEKNRVNIDAWIMKDRKVNNVGDIMAVVIVDYMCEMLDLDVNKRISSTRHLYSVGSTLLGFQDAVIWGSGFGYDISRSRWINVLRSLHLIKHRIDIRAVRGPETLRILNSLGYTSPKENQCSFCFGDPAVLLPLFYNKVPTKKKEYLVIPHYSKDQKYSGKKNVLMTFTANWKEFVDRLLDARLVISSSLHGIIIAEAYGIPAIMLNDTPSKDITKYKDWYYSTGRVDFPIANSVEDALSITPSKLDPEVLIKMQDDLIESFPKDLWE